MSKYLILFFLLLTMILKAEYIVGDHIPDMTFIDTNVDSLGQIIYTEQSTKDIISSGKIIVISYFSPGWSSCLSGARSLCNILTDFGTDSLYIVGVCSRDGYTDKDLNGEMWRDLYGVGLNYQISNYNDLGKEASMFEPNEYSYPLVIIGQDSKIVFSNLGYFAEDDIRPEIQKALDGFGNLQQIKKTKNIFLDVA